MAESDPSAFTLLPSSCPPPSPPLCKQKDVEGNEFMEEKPADSSISLPVGATTQPASSLEKKIRRAERFGVPVQLSEEEKRSTRAERFGTTSSPTGKDVGISEEQKRKARAERFGIAEQIPTDQEAKKKARLDRFSQNPKPNAVEEEKRKARAARFSGTTTSSESNGKVSFKLEL
ncbi:hypothetical protein KSP40_PGU016637 [Platanthera guangdongensis]|uniref:THO1-MOS11 C-terminal domain-containing protein n=1 Tax=Platanthera guangdongensis TaxID=2320717 RepID=A0ABR2LU35_9ASPA